MKNCILICIAALGINLVAGCADREVRSTTTTTEESTVQHPVVGQTTTTETRAVRSAY